jgi:uncharacterized protein (DUF885 family)
MPELPRYFSRLPAAPFRLRPLNTELSGMTYGYCQPPTRTDAGYYHYNASNLPDRPLLQAASLMYHEGLPGHHLQMSLLAENTALHPIRREQSELRTFAINGYLEGWAEYAAGLCEEIGMYLDPRDRYGRMTSERFLAARLVADTGLNVFGWSLASCPSPRSPANCCATRSMTPARRRDTTWATGTRVSCAAPGTSASSTTRCSPTAPSHYGSSARPRALPDQ